MQKVAGYSLVATQIGSAQLDRLNVLVETWLHSKGSLSSDGDLNYVTFPDGRKADYSSSVVETKSGTVREHTLVEPTESGLFQTHIALGMDAKQIGVYVELRAAGDTYLLGPSQLDVRCPQIVRSIMNSGDEWFVGDTLVTSKPVQFKGEVDGQTLVEILWHETRNLPVVVVSQHEGKTLTENFSENLAGDLSGLALVAEIDPYASWAISKARGKDWGCFGGALRVYWPMKSRLTDPYSHPLWTRSRLLGGVTEAKDASYRIRRQLRRQIIGLSAFSVSEPGLFSSIRTEARKREMDALIERAAATNDWQEMAETLIKDNDRLNSDLERQKLRVEELEGEVSNLKLALQWQRSAVEAQEVQPESEAPPATVAEAVQRAKDTFPESLVFGDDVDRGVQSLAPDAGPPEKIFKYLGHLAEMADVHRKGPLGKTAVLWLKERGVSASVESETVRNAGGRRWHDGNDDHSFDLHLKPSDATSPDKCVRIYFAHDEKENLIRVGWVGRHP